MIRIAIIGDHKLATGGIAALLQHEAAYEVSGPLESEDWRSLLSQAEPHLLLLISHRRGFVPGQLIGDIRQALPRCRIVFVSLVEDDGVLLSALKSGVEGALDVNVDAAFLIRCIRGVLRGEIVISQAVARKLVGEYRALAAGTGPASRRDVLTAREVLILRLIARGKSNKAIAQGLSISEHTVRAHARSIMRKLEVANRVQATAVAFRSGLAAS